MRRTVAADIGPEALAARIRERAERLSRCSEAPGQLTRRFATPALGEAVELVGSWMRDAGMTVAVDAVGNLLGRCEGAEPAAPALLIGSHLDTVPDGGRWDGALGVLVGLALAESIEASGRRLPFAIEVVGFADEEGTRYGTTYLGSSALVGSFDPAWLARRDVDGISRARALRASGGDPAAIAGARRDPATLLGYLEVHIEQGPVLEAAGEPLGVVTAIAGQTRARGSFTGTSGHAGTVPPRLRRDALCAAAALTLEVERQALTSDGLVATVGELAVEPGAANVIPGRASFSLDVRHGEDAVRRVSVEALEGAARELADQRGLELGWELILDQPAVALDTRLLDLLAEAVPGEAPIRRLTSGAGHDAAVIAAAVPAAMLFVRCRGGVSHHPDEEVADADVSAAIESLGRFLELLATSVAAP